MPRVPPTFHLKAKNIFITYTQCPLPKEETLDIIKTLFTDQDVKPFYIRIASETHLDDDGNKHHLLHCLLRFDNQFETRNPRFFDLSSSRSRSGSFLPNVVRSAMNDGGAEIRSYLSKYGEFIDYGEYKETVRIPKPKLQDVFAAALRAGSLEEALRVIRDGAPRHYVLYHHRLVKNLSEEFKSPPDPFVPLFSEFRNTPPELQRWAADNVKEETQRPDQPISLIIEGPSRTGKTCWARSLGKHNYYCGVRMDLKNHDDSALYNVIDEVNPRYLKKNYWKPFIGAKEDWTADCRYAKPRRIRGGIPSIIICKPGPKSSFTEFLSHPTQTYLRQWTNVNATTVHITHPLFSETTPPSSTSDSQTHEAQPAEKKSTVSVAAVNSSTRTDASLGKMLGVPIQSANSIAA